MANDVMNKQWATDGHVMWVEYLKGADLRSNFATDKSAYAEYRTCDMLNIQIKWKS